MSVEKNGEVPEFMPRSPGRQWLERYMKEGDSLREGVEKAIWGGHISVPAACLFIDGAAEYIDDMNTASAYESEYYSSHDEALELISNVGFESEAFTRGSKNQYWINWHNAIQWHRNKIEVEKLSSQYVEDSTQKFVFELSKGRPSRRGQ